MECGLNGSSLRCVLVYEACFKFYSCNEDIKPSAAFSCRHVKYKIHAAECTKFLTRHFYFKNSKIFWGGAQPPPGPLPSGRTHPLCACGASNSRLRRSLTHPPLGSLATGLRPGTIFLPLIVAPAPPPISIRCYIIASPR